jgi:succinate dehydrogenase (ubiquinone) cytochrome b560 subunit
MIGAACSQNGRSGLVRQPRCADSAPAGFFAAGYVALTGDLPGALASFKANYPILVFPTKFIISFPLVYHYLGGMRHFVWDLYKIGNQADKTSLLETPRVEQSSQILFGASAALSLVMAIL